MNNSATPALMDKKIIWVGGHYFLGSLRKMGVKPKHFHILEKPCTWDWLVQEAGFEPDVLIYGDHSLQPMFLGLEEYPCLTVFLSVDSHIHSWYPTYAQCFDLCTVSLRDHLPRYQNKRLPDERLLWMPPFARDEDQPADAEKEFDLLFVGNVGEDIFPIRTRLLEEIGKHFPGLKVMQGNYRELYPKARLVLNIAERGDMNYRLFEALACRSCLLTPEIGHGMDELFRDGRDLFTYPQENVDALLKLAQKLLADQELCQRVSESGFQKVDSAHRAHHRAATLDQWIGGFDAGPIIRNRLSKAKLMHDAYLRLIYLHLADNLDDDRLRSCYLKASKRDYQQ